MLNELGNESKIHNGSMLFVGKQEISPLHPNVSFKFSSLICHKKEQKQIMKELCTTYAPRRIFQKVLKTQVGKTNFLGR